MTTINTTPRLFVTDYASYNAGEQFKAGAWYDLDAYSDINELMEAIEDNYISVYAENFDFSELELMVTDFEGFPEDLYSEGFDSKTISQIIELAQLDDEQREITEAFIDCFGGDLQQALNNYKDAYVGQYNSDEDFAEEMAEQMGYETPSGWPYNCIDWERAARDLMFDYSESNGYYFLSNW